MKDLSTRKIYLGKKAKEDLSPRLGKAGYDVHKPFREGELLIAWADSLDDEAAEAFVEYLRLPGND